MFKCRPVRIIFETESGERIVFEDRDLEIFIETTESALLHLSLHVPGALEEWNKMMERKFKACRG